MSPTSSTASNRASIRTPGGSASLMVVCVATLAVLINYTAPMTVVPLMAAELHAGTTAQTWLLNGTTAGLAISLLVTGALGDTFGRRRAFVAGSLLLAAGSVASLFATDAVTYVLCRVVQGIGSAAVLAAGLGLLGQVFAVEAERARATAAWGAMLGAGIAIGPFLSAAGAAVAGWRSFAVVVALIALAVAALSSRTLPESDRLSGKGFDTAGALTLAVGAGALMVVATDGRSGWTAPDVLVAEAVAAIAVAAFVLLQRYRSRPLLDLSLFASAAFRLGIVGSLLAGLAVIGPMSLLPTLLQRVHGLSPAWTAVLFAVWSGAAFAVSWLMRRHGTGSAGNRQFALGAALSAAGALAMVAATALGPVAWLMPGLLVAGVGSGLINTSLARAAVGGVSAGQVAMSSGAANTGRYIGSALGLAFAVAAAGVTAGHPWTTGMLDRCLLLGAVLAALSAGLGLALGKRRAGPAMSMSMSMSTEPATSRPSAGQMIPCASIASATCTKPEMLAPTT